MRNIPDTTAVVAGILFLSLEKISPKNNLSIFRENGILVPKKVLKGEYL